MRLKDFKAPTRADVKEVEKWMEKYLEPTHEQMKKVTQALQRKLSFGSNMNSDLKKVSVEHDTATEMSVAIDGKAEEVTLAFWDWPEAAYIKTWENVDVGKIRVTVVFEGTPPTAPTLVHIRVHGGDGGDN